MPAHEKAPRRAGRRGALVSAGEKLVGLWPRSSGRGEAGRRSARRHHRLREQTRLLVAPGIFFAETWAGMCSPACGII